MSFAASGGGIVVPSLCCYRSVSGTEAKMYVKTIGPAEATGELAALYEAEIQSMGRVMEATEC